MPTISTADIEVLRQAIRYLEELQQIRTEQHNLDEVENIASICGALESFTDDAEADAEAI